MSCPCLAVVGSRKCSEYGLRICARIVQDLSKAGITIVSGFALGIDRKAHIAAFSGQGSSIAVLGTGLDTVYPARNRDLWGKLCRSGLVVTEFAPRVKPEAHHFPRRNRIISGLSLGVLVVEGSKNSGSLITAGCALEQGREVFAVPGPLQGENFSGCHHLIRQGGTLVTSAQDIMDELEWSIKALYPHSSAAVDYYAHKDAAVGTANKNIKHDWQDLNADELQLVQIMQKQARLHIDVLAGQVGWDSNRLSSTLLMLEMKGVVKQITGMYYALEN